MGSSKPLQQAPLGLRRCQAPVPAGLHVPYHDLQRLAVKVPYKVVRVPEVEAVRRQVHVLLPEVEGPHVLRVVQQSGAASRRGEVAAAGFGGRGAGAAVRA